MLLLNHICVYIIWRPCYFLLTMYVWKLYVIKFHISPWCITQNIVTCYMKFILSCCKYIQPKNNNVYSRYIYIYIYINNDIFTENLNTVHMKWLVIVYSCNITSMHWHRSLVNTRHDVSHTRIVSNEPIVGINTVPSTKIFAVSATMSICLFIVNVLSIVDLKLLNW